MFIKRVYEMDLPACPECGGKMRVIAFIEPRELAFVDEATFWATF